jgi:hypothetical protein
MVVTKPVTSSGQLHAGGRHRKQALHRKAAAPQRFSAAKLVAVGAVAAVLVAVLALAGLIAKWATEDSVPVAVASQPPSPTEPAPIPQPPATVAAETHRSESPPAFPSDDRGFVGSSARCQETKSAYAIGRTQGSLVVICAKPAGRYEYLGVRLSDAAVLRTDAETITARGFLAQKSGVVYAVSSTN